MAIEVVKAGDLKQRDPVVEVSCSECGCVFRCSRSDTRADPDPREISGVRLVSCPTCGVDVWITFKVR